ncbi:hypothetical protein JCM1393_17650 [Clostridium carnis]
MSDYSREYRDYYNSLKSKVGGGEQSKEKIKQENAALHSTESDIYPIVKSQYGGSYQRGSYQRENYQRGSYGYNYRNSYQNGQDDSKKMGYINWFIIRLIGTSLLFLLVFSLKILPNKEAKDIYATCKEVVSTDFQYKDFFNNLKNISGDYSEVIDGTLKGLEDKYTDVLKNIKSARGDVKSFNNIGNTDNIDDLNTENKD